MATAHQFKKGHRILIQVQNSWFPLVDINPQSFVNIYEADEKDLSKRHIAFIVTQNMPLKYRLVF